MTYRVRSIWKFVAVAVGGLMALTTAACGSSGGGSNPKGLPEGVKEGSPLAKLIHEAQKEGSVSIYAALAPQQVDSIGDAFEKTYGIKVNRLRLVSGELIQRFSAEVKSKSVQADVVVASTYPPYTDTDWFKNLKTSNIPAYNALASKYKGTTFAAVSYFIWDVLYNKNMVKEDELPRDWTGFLDGKWKGKILLADPRTVPSRMSWFVWADKKYGDDFVRKLGAQAVRTVSSNSTGAQEIASGAASVLLPSTEIVVTPEMEKVVGYKAIYPTEGANYIAGIPKQAPHSAAARLLMNWMLTKAGQKAINTVGPGARAVVTDVPGALPDPTGTVAQPDFAATKENGDRISQLLGLS